jgi:ribosomal protein S18 acetylase RimI-like enzyme
MIAIREINEFNQNDLNKINQFIPMLSQSASLLTPDHFAEIVKSSATHLYVAEEHNLLMGMLSLVVFPIPTGSRAWIEDVVVDEKARGKGIGRLLTLHALEESKKLDVVSVDLTSRPSRVAANHLYQSVGFEKRDTNIYRFKHAS